MRYLMQQKLFALGDDFFIKDENGRDLFFVDGKVFSFGDKLSFQDMERNELAFIKQRVFAWRPTYHIYRDGAVVATVRKKLLTFLRCKFFIDVAGAGQIVADGSILDHEYTLRRGGRTIAGVSKEWFTIRDTYGVDIADGEDDLLLLAAVIVIDMVCHKPRHNSN